MTILPRVLRYVVTAGVMLYACAAGGAPAVEQVKVMMFAVPETLWQAELKEKPRTAAEQWAWLGEKLRQGKAELPLDLVCDLKAGAPFQWQRGEKRTFVTGWQSTDTKPEVKVDSSKEVFVGTSLTMTSEGVQPDGALRVALALQHHTEEPVMRPINFANAAEGAERERLSVAYPEFATLEWRGRVSCDDDWRLVAQILHSPEEPGKAVVPAQRYLIFITRVWP